jgi:cell division protein FtsZ
MTQNGFTLIESSIRIMIVGVGNGGCQTVNYVAKNGAQTVETLVIDTDIQTLLYSRANKRILIGEEFTHGKGTSGNVDIGQMAAEEATDDLMKSFAGLDVIFITSGLGGGTGTGAIPAILSIAQKAGAVVVCILTTPFEFEGRARNNAASKVLKQIEGSVNALVVVSADDLFREGALSPYDGLCIFQERFHKNVLALTDLVVIPGLINLDMADLRAILSGCSVAFIGSGEASGEFRAQKAAENAIINTFGNLKSLKDAENLLFNITGGADLTLFEVNIAAATIREKANPDINMIFGAVIDPLLEGKVHVTLFAGRAAPITNGELDTELSSLGNVMFSKDSIERSLQVFLCHSSNDKPIVRKLFQRLYSRKGIDPWLDEAKLLPGVRWDHEIAKAVKESDVVIVCISKNSVNKEEYIQKEIKRALDIADKKPDETIFIIPLKVEDCEVPERLRQWQWVNYYEDGAFDRLLSSLQKRAKSLGINIE